MKKYTTKSGDTFDLIAFQQMGDCQYVEQLLNANRQYVNVYVFEAGVELIIPDVVEEKVTSSLPPWRR